ncbi:MAG: endonuclease III [Eubacteriales bacterium]|nr:endonuclease III [Eubacteriales bacterium]
MLTPKERAEAAVMLLEQEYPDAICALQYKKDYELLFATRLSAQCTDKRVNIVTQDLYTIFPTLESFAQAQPEEIEKIIRPCGLGRTKARDLNAAAQYLLEVHGGKVPGTMEELLKIPGVGRKTANLILGDLYGKPAIVTDTHCIRLSNRIGLVDGIKEPGKVEKALRPIVPPEASSDFCHRLVLHGRDVCTARKPYCDKCCLKEICMTGSGEKEA